MMLLGWWWCLLVAAVVAAFDDVAVFRGGPFHYRSSKNYGDSKNVQTMGWV